MFCTESRNVAAYLGKFYPKLGIRHGQEFLEWLEENRGKCPVCGEPVQELPLKSTLCEKHQNEWKGWVHR